MSKWEHDSFHPKMMGAYESPVDRVAARSSQSGICSLQCRFSNPQAFSMYCAAYYDASVGRQSAVRLSFDGYEAFVYQKNACSELFCSSPN